MILWSIQAEATSLSLPLELENIPYPLSGDNGYRVEVIVPRPLFIFEVKDNNISTFDYECKLANPLPNWKMNVSILTIYDTYGLAIVKQFCNSLPITYKSRASLLQTYVLECASILGISTVRYRYPASDDAMRSLLNTIQDMCSELERRDALLPRASTDITFMPLPIEIVAQIVDSVRISKQLAAVVRVRRALVIPSLELALLRTKNSSTYHLSDCYRLVSEASTYNLSWCENKYSLAYQITNSSIVRGQRTLVATSLSNYRSFYKTRCGESENGMSNMFDHLEKLSVEASIEEVCAWVVQLCYDTRSEINREDMEEAQLRELLRDLVAKCR